MDTFVWTFTEEQMTWQNFKWVSRMINKWLHKCSKLLFYFLFTKSGQPSRRPEDACNSQNFDAQFTDSITLVGKSLIAKIFQLFVERPSAESRYPYKTNTSIDCRELAMFTI